MSLPKAVTALVMILISPFDDFHPEIFIHLNDLDWNKGCTHDFNLLEKNKLNKKKKGLPWWLSG